MSKTGEELDREVLEQLVREMRELVQALRAPFPLPSVEQKQVVLTGDPGGVIVTADAPPVQAAWIIATAATATTITAQVGTLSIPIPANGTALIPIVSSAPMVRLVGGSAGNPVTVTVVWLREPRVMPYIRTL